MKGCYQLTNLPSHIIKRDGSSVVFDKDKIHNAVSKAVFETNELTSEDITNVVEHVLVKISNLPQPEELTVETTQDIVEESLIEMNFPKTAKAYILYRQKRIDERKPDIFKKRLELKPYEYPHLLDFSTAIRQAYWVHTDYNYTADMDDYDINATEVERSVITNAMLAIAQVEIAVKTFWGDLYHRMPKAEIGSVGYTFAESEVRHHDAYAHLLELMRLDNRFKEIRNIPALMKRVAYLDKAIKNAKTNDNKDFTKSILLFSLFTEHVSLFSQFLIIMSFNKYKNMFPGISNAIEATSKEEQLHGMFGIELIRIIRDENPTWFDDQLEEEVYEACREAYKAEEKIVDWIYEAGDLDFMPKATVKEYIKFRFNSSLKNIGYQPIFEVDDKLVNDTLWFEEELDMTKHVDFFYKRSVNYMNHSTSVTAKDLF